MAATIGILLFETAGRRLPGDPGSDGTFDFPVIFGFVKGSYRDLIHGSAAVMGRINAAAKELERQGASAIVGDCGLMAIYQRKIANAVAVPVISSALVLLPLIRSIINSGAPIGIITGHSALLTERHLGNIKNCAIQGMENEAHFREVVIDGTGVPNRALMARDLTSAAGKLRRNHGGAGAFLLECSNLASCSHELYEMYNIPVFDINDAVRLLHSSVCKLHYDNNEHDGEDERVAFLGV